MKIPQLEKKPELKSCHNVTWEDNYSWIHQNNILEVLKDSSKLLPEVRKYLEDENNYTEENLKDTKEYQKKLFDEIKGRIKLDDESLPFKDKNYEYWTKTTTKGNYSIKLRKKIGSNNIEEIWNGDKEKEKLKTEYFGVGDLEVSYNDKYLGYSLDLKGSDDNSAMSILTKSNVVLVIDTQGITRGIAPLLQGYINFETKCNIQGIILNKVNNERHENKLVNAVKNYTDLKILGSVRKNKELIISERHLGLIPANEQKLANNIYKKHA